jgi:hypothetical protein
MQSFSMRDGMRPSGRILLAFRMSIDESSGGT